MGTRDWQKIETIIDTVLELPKEQRQTYIDEQCKGNKQLKSEVTLLLESIFDSEGWLDNPGTFKEGFYSDISEHRLPHSSPDALIDKQIGSYILKELIGEGGMGTVYRAERTGDGFDHQVAIKIIRHERATEKNIRRFEHEQRILAGLSHPGIAKFFDGGITEEGFPYIIMEYVSGIPIDEYCQTQNYSVDEKLSLFKQVLEAVRYAHENLVIHRDLKPGNILVDESGSIKILDFGISKLLAQDESQDLTQTGARLLTPRYAAPEQIKQQNITTATDLYALGLILFRLLTEAYPFALDNQNQYEIEQTILNTEPVKPSSAVDSKQLQKTLSGDLDAIILKALRKEPEKRYRVASEFLDDLDDYEQGIPVGAHADSMSYRTGKFFKRHKQGVAIAAGILLLLIGLTGFYTWRIAQERDEARLHAQRAELQAERAEQVSEFMIDLFDSTKPEQTPGEDIPVSTVIDAGIQGLKNKQMSPANRATILGVIAQVQIKLSEIESAQQLSNEALGLVMDSVKNHNPSTLDIPTIYGQIAYQTGNFTEALQAFQVGDSLFKANNLTDTYEYRTLKYNLVNLYTEQKKYQEALQVLDNLNPETWGNDEEAIIEKSDFYNYKAIALKNLGQQRKALPIYKKALEYRLKGYGTSNPEVGTIYNNISSLYISLDQHEKALEYAEQAYKIRKETLGPNHSLTATPIWALSVINRSLNNYKKALRYAKEAGTILKETLGANHWRYAYTIRGQAEVLIKMNKFIKAREKIDKAIEIINTNYPSNITFKAHFNATYTNIYKGLEDLDKAAEYYSKSIDFFRKGMGDKHPQLGQMLASYAKMEMERENYKKAHPLLKETLEIQQHNEQSDEELQATQRLIDECVNKLSPATTIATN